MATTYKTFSANDIVSTRTLLHEAIPLTGTIVSGTYKVGSTETNIKNYSHGMFQSVFDYPYLSSSANHIFDISVGMHSSSSLSASTSVQRSKKLNIYTQMAQVLMGYDHTGSVRMFDEDGDLSGGGLTGKFKECIFINFSRLLTKDEIKKGTFKIELDVESAFTASKNPAATHRMKLYDKNAENNYFVNSPAGDYGILYADTTTSNGDTLTTDNQEQHAGLLFYQAGIAVLPASIFGGASNQAATALKCLVGNDATTANIPNEKDYIIIVSTDGTKRVYVVTNSVGGGAATGATLTSASDTGGDTLGSTIAALGDCVAVQLNLSSAKQYEVLNAFKDAIEHSNGHGSKLTLGADALNNGDPQTISITQADGTAANRHLGNTVVTKSFTGDSATKITIANFAGGGSGGILKTTMGAPVMNANERHNSFQSMLTGSEISASANQIRHRIYNIEFNNTTELNSTVYFCRAHHNEFNYSNNPSYVAASKIEVKNQASDSPIAYITGVGLYSADNELLASAKVSEPLRKDPTNELTLRVRLDY